MEWNESLFPGATRGLRGGSFGSGYDLRSINCTFTDPASETEHIGFRVAEVPEPASAVLVALGACLPLLRKRR